MSSLHVGSGRVRYVSHARHVQCDTWCRQCGRSVGWALRRTNRAVASRVRRVTVGGKQRGSMMGHDGVGRGLETLAGVLGAKSGDEADVMERGASVAILRTFGRMVLSPSGWWTEGV